MKYDNQNFIGVFDSGIGGISVLNELIARMPSENYIYFADAANFPYGKKSKAELFDIGKGIISQFDDKNAKALVIACNTMSTCDMDGFKKTFPNLEIIGTFPSFTHIFKPGLVLSEQSISCDKENGINISRNKKKLLVLATTSTCKSKFLNDLIKDCKGLIDIYVEASDFIARAVENDEINTFEFKKELSELLKEYSDIDYLVLGCTHFPFAIDEIRAILGNDVHITSGSEITVDNCYNYLSKNNLLTKNESPYIRIIDVNLNESKINLYQKLITLKNKSHEIEFSKTF